MKLYIKNRLCNRCILVVKSELEKLGLDYISIALGEVFLKNKISSNEKINIENRLKPFGFELLDDLNSKIIHKIKTALIDLVQNKNNKTQVNTSNYLKEILHQDYSKISNLFKEVEGISIEKYFIFLKIEKVKELIIYNELSFTEITDKLNYSSSAHLSTQFKKVTGFTPTYFKQIKENKRKHLDQL
jgi:AraC-like DNA-binding protein